MNKVFVVYDTTDEFIYGVFSNEEKANSAVKLADSDTAVVYEMFIDVFQNIFSEEKVNL